MKPIAIIVAVLSPLVLAAPQLPLPDLSQFGLISQNSIAPDTPGPAVPLEQGAQNIAPDTLELVASKVPVEMECTSAALTGYKDFWNCCPRAANEININVEPKDPTQWGQTCKVARLRTNDRNRTPLPGPYYCCQYHVDNPQVFPLTRANNKQSYDMPSSDNGYTNSNTLLTDNPWDEGNLWDDPV